MTATPPPPAAPPFLRCDQCGIVLAADALNTAAPVPCPSCRAMILGQVFPALFRVPAAGEPGENLLPGAEAEAACFFHPHKRAATPCAQCGRFLCRLCDLDFGDGRHLCPECVRAGRDQGRMPELENGRTFHDRLALLLSVVPVLVILVWPFTLFTAPAALFLTLRYWHEPALGPVPRSRGALLVAIALSLLQIAAWAAGGVWLLHSFL